MKMVLLSAPRCVGALLMGLVVACAAVAQTGNSTMAAEVASTSVPAASGHKASPFRATKMTANAKQYYASAWGVDKLKVSYTQSGNLIRFSYRVAVPEQARMLADKSATPYLFGQKSRAMLQIPVMDKVGQLRQTAEPKAGQEYWMVFSNKGNLIKPGDRVNVVIGTFHADGLVVE
jgi:hypothetical protein